jgi:hypothetical protein
MGKQCKKYEEAGVAGLLCAEIWNGDIASKKLEFCPLDTGVHGYKSRKFYNLDAVELNTQN